MPDRPLAGMIQTIVALRRLQLDEAAQQLQQKQIAISQGNLDLAMSQRPLNTIGALQGVLANTDNPSAFAPYAPQFAGQAGVSPDMISQFIQHTPAAATTTRSRAVQSGAAKAGGSLDQPAAYAAVAGATQGDLARDQLLSSIFGQAGDYYSSLTPEQKSPFVQGVLQRTATGQSMSEAAQDLAARDFFDRADQPTKDQIIKVGKGLAPSASEDAQIQLGWGNLRLGRDRMASDAALDTLKTKAALANAQGQLDAKAFEEVNQLITHRSELLTNMARNSATMTPEGIRSFAQQLNAFNAQIRNAAPQIYGTYRDTQGNMIRGSSYLEDIPLDATLSATGFSDYLRARLNTPR